MIDVTRIWWVIALRGVLAVGFGVLTLFWPGITIAVLVLFYGAYALVDGVFSIIASIRAAEAGNRWWPALLEGVVGILVGVVTFFWPAITAIALLYIIAFWALVTGVLEVAAAIHLRREIEGEWLLALGGLASILFAVILVVAPIAGALAIGWMIGAYALIFGAALIALGFRLRGAAA